MKKQSNVKDSFISLFLVEGCPYFSNHIANLVERTTKRISRSVRKGMSPAGPRPLSALQELAAIALAYIPLAKKKDIAAALGITPQLLSRWIKQQSIQKAIASYQALYPVKYVGFVTTRVEKLCSIQAEFGTKADQGEKFVELQSVLAAHFTESRLYPEIIQALIFELLKSQDELVWTYRFLSTAVGLDIYNPPGDKRELEKFRDRIRTISEISSSASKEQFETLRAAIIASDKNKALNTVYLLEDLTLGNIQEIEELRLAATNGSKRLNNQPA